MKPVFLRKMGAAVALAAFVLLLTLLTGCEQPSGPLPIRIVKQLCQQPLGIGQRTMASGGRRRIDNHQPQFRGRPATQVKQHICTALRPAAKQGARPVDRTLLRAARLALPASVQSPCLGPGIRPRVRSGANA